MDETEIRHDETDDCNGRPVTGPCVECGARLCACEHAYGHDCEA